MNPQDLKPNTIVRGPMFPEPVKIIRVVPMGGSIKLVGQGMNTGLVHQPILSPAPLANLNGSPEQQPFDGDATKFKLGVEALRLGIAYEYDPYFSLSIARVDPLPHQLEAVYDYFLRLPRIRFLLADDPGAGKTIMAGLLIKELKVRGLVKRILIVTPANLSFQWQRELKDKFQSPRSSISLYALPQSQLVGDGIRIRSEGQAPVKVLNAEVHTNAVAPGGTTWGLVEFEWPPRTNDPAVLKFAFPSDGAGEVSAVLVL